MGWNNARPTVFFGQEFNKIIPTVMFLSLSNRIIYAIKINQHFVLFCCKFFGSVWFGLVRFGFIVAHPVGFQNNFHMFVRWVIYSFCYECFFLLSCLNTILLLLTMGSQIPITILNHQNKRLRN